MLLQLTFAPDVEREPCHTPLPAPVDAAHCSVKFSKRRRIMTFCCKLAKPQQQSCGVPGDQVCPDGRGRPSYNALASMSNDEQAAARQELYGFNDPPPFVASCSSRRLSGSHTHAEQPTHTRSAIQHGSTRQHQEMGSAAPAGKHTVAPERTQISQWEAAGQQLKDATSNTQAQRSGRSWPQRGILQEHNLAAPVHPAAPAECMTDSEEPVDLLNGVKTGGEHLPAVPAESTGNALNGQGIAACLSKDRLAGAVVAKLSAKQAESKKHKRELRKRVEFVAKAAGKALSQHSWIAIDNFVPSPAVAAIRKEIAVMEANYEAGEIWVGSSNEVGAQIKRESVRGDAVLWMGDQALSAKEFVKNGTRKTCCFHTLRSVIHSIDQFITKVLSRCAQSFCPHLCWQAQHHCSAGW